MGPLSSGVHCSLTAHLSGLVQHLIKVTTKSPLCLRNAMRCSGLPGARCRLDMSRQGCEVRVAVTCSIGNVNLCEE